jgi:predicted RNase H-like HicB family nuclease
MSETQGVANPTAEAAAAAPGPVRIVAIEVRVRLQAVALPEADGGYSFVVPALPGCATQGDTLDEALANVVEAAEGWLAVAHDRQKDQAIRDMLP